MATKHLTPDPETSEKPKRRRFKAAYKLKILKQTDEADEGQIGAIMRREGLYSSLLSTWRHQQETGTLEALAPRSEDRSRPRMSPRRRSSACSARSPDSSTSSRRPS